MTACFGKPIASETKPPPKTRTISASPANDPALVSPTIRFAHRTKQGPHAGNACQLCFLRFMLVLQLTDLSPSPVTLRISFSVPQFNLFYYRHLGPILKRCRHHPCSKLTKPGSSQWSRKRLSSIIRQPLYNSMPACSRSRWRTRLGRRIHNYITLHPTE